MAKVSVIGAGHVGATCAYTLLKNGVADVVMVDVVDGLAKGKALDMSQAGAVEGYNLRVIGTSDYGEIAGSDVIVITAGLARQPGMSRTDLLGKNVGILKSVLENVVRVEKDAILVVVTNPLDIMADLTHKWSGYPAQRIIGMGGVLDTARYKYFISQALNVSMSRIDGMVIGSHSDHMFPVTSHTMVNGEPLMNLISQEQAEEIINKTKNGGAEIVSYLKTGSAYYAPGASSALIARLIIDDAQAIIPAAVYAQGQYGIENMFIGMPARIGRNGVEEIIEIPLTEQEMQALHESAQAVRDSIDSLSNLEQ